MIRHRLTACAKSPDEPFERFAAAVLSPDIAEPTLRQMRSLARILTCGTGESARIDESRDQVVFVDSGATKLVAYASAGREQVVAFHFAGDIVCIPARASHHYALAALEPVTLVAFPAPSFLALAREDARIMSVLFDRTMIALHRCREKTISLGRKSASERIAAFLSTMAGRIGSGPPELREVYLPMSRRDIADSLGLTIETVSRQFSELKAAELIETSGRSVLRIRDMAELEARAGHLAFD